MYRKKSFCRSYFEVLVKQAVLVFLRVIEMLSRWHILNNKVRIIYGTLGAGMENPQSGTRIVDYLF